MSIFKRKDDACACSEGVYCNEPLRIEADAKAAKSKKSGKPGKKFKTVQCVHHLLGNCTNQDCTFSHDGTGKLPECTHYKRGKCTRGNSCPFSHGNPSTSLKKASKQYPPQIGQM